MHFFIALLLPPDRLRRSFTAMGVLPRTAAAEGALAAADTEMLIEISGQDQGRGILKRLVNLPPKTRVTVDDPFYSVRAVHVKNIPSARLGIHFPACKETYVISPLEWGNIWVYGMDIILAGFISRGEFRQRAKWIARPIRARFNMIIPKQKIWLCLFQN